MATIANAANTVQRELIAELVRMDPPHLTDELRAAAVQKLDELAERVKEDRVAVAAARSFIESLERDAAGVLRRARRVIDIEQVGSGRAAGRSGGDFVETRATRSVDELRGAWRAG
ncbi:hypothetical protein [Spongiactinospora sp. 9N601]|uniref:hypothetical protein n=1 Tax=Spongiactinospora sp. 9N601 TaxID=3375149 RepID=UPI00379659E9